MYSISKDVKAGSRRRLSREALALVAARFRALSEPVRLAMLQCLEDGPRTVSELATEAGTTQPNASKHLNVLEGAGFVRRGRRAGSVACELAGPWVFELCETVCRSLGERFLADAEALGGDPAGDGSRRRPGRRPASRT